MDLYKAYKKKICIAVCDRPKNLEMYGRLIKKIKITVF